MNLYAAFGREPQELKEIILETAEFIQNCLAGEDSTVYNFYLETNQIWNEVFACYKWNHSLPPSPKLQVKDL